jgi:hypothetical protein
MGHSTRNVIAVNEMIDGKVSFTVTRPSGRIRVTYLPDRSRGYK